MPTTPLPVAGLQLDIVWEDPQANFARADTLAAHAVASGARLIVLPEMFATGFSMAADRIAGHAAAIRAYLADLARRHGAWVLGGYAEPFDSRPRNAAALFDPSGTGVLDYHKIHPFSFGGEDKHFAGGTRVLTADVEGVFVTPLICYDLRFPEPFRAAAAGTDLFVVIANWPQARRLHWSTLLRARAIENQAFVLGVNRVGEGDGLLYSGDSALIDPLGEIVGTAAAQPAVDGGEVSASRRERRAWWRMVQPAVVGGEVSAAVVADVRAQFSFLADRKPEVYAEMVRRR